MAMHDRERILLIGLQLFMGAVAILCGAILAIGMASDVMGMDREILTGTPFTSFVIPGVILVVVVGGSLLIAAIALLQRRAWGMTASLVAGVILMGWITVQVAMIGWTSPAFLQPFVFLYGALIAGLSMPDLWTRAHAR